MKKHNVILLCVMLVLLTASITFSLTMHFATPHLLDKYPTAKKVAVIESKLQNYFIDEYDSKKLGDEAAKAIIEATGDPWSFYLSADEVNGYKDHLDNAYTGIGVTIYEEPSEKGFTVATVQEGGPADKSGIRVGDVLTHVEGESALEMGFSEMRNRIRGGLGTWINLTFDRGESTYTVGVQRRRIDTLAADKIVLDSGVGYVRIANFDRNSAEQTIACIKERSEQGVQEIIFDVRTNPGGLRAELVKLLDYLLPEGAVFKSYDYTGKEETEYSDADFLNMKMAVLVDRHTYSAAEFFAAALQEYGAAKVVGERTSGKGNYQSMVPLSDGSALNISIGKYYTPSGKSLTGVGVTPDRIIPIPDDGNPEEAYTKQLETAEELLLQSASVKNGS